MCVHRSQEITGGMELDGYFSKIPLRAEGDPGSVITVRSHHRKGLSKALRSCGIPRQQIPLHFDQEG